LFKRRHSDFSRFSLTAGRPRLAAVKDQITIDIARLRRD
jgi:hypothetical protein